MRLKYFFKKGNSQSQRLNCIHKRLFIILDPGFSIHFKLRQEIRPAKVIAIDFDEQLNNTLTIN